MQHPTNDKKWLVWKAYCPRPRPARPTESASTNRTERRHPSRTGQCSQVAFVGLLSILFRIQVAGDVATQQTLTCQRTNITFLRRCPIIVIRRRPTVAYNRTFYFTLCNIRALVQFVCADGNIFEFSVCLLFASRIRTQWTFTMVLDVPWACVCVCSINPRHQTYPKIVYHFECRRCWSCHISDTNHSSPRTIRHSWTVRFDKPVQRFQLRREYCRSLCPALLSPIRAYVNFSMSQHFVFRSLQTLHWKISWIEKFLVKNWDKNQMKINEKCDS